MSKNYFEVGEMVIGNDSGNEYLIEDMRKSHPDKQHTEGAPITGNCGYGYLIEKGWACQCSIRKKHKPGEDWKTFRKSLDHPVSEVR